MSDRSVTVQVEVSADPPEAFRIFTEEVISGGCAGRSTSSTRPAPSPCVSSPASAGVFSRCTIMSL